jgi:phytoene dehydrogenase-like protein
MLWGGRWRDGTIVAVGGDSVSGSHHLRQSFGFRPAPGWSRCRMPVDQLYMVGAAIWPGAGTHATSGYLAAQELLRRGGLRRRALGLSAWARGKIVGKRGMG